MMPSKSFVFHFDDVEVWEREFTLTKAGKVLAVEPKAFRTLLFLLHNPQRLITKEELLNTVWGRCCCYRRFPDALRLVLLVSALGDDIHQPRYIKTVATVGYRFVCEVEVSEDMHGAQAPADLPDGGGGSKRLDLSAQAAGGPIRSFRRWWLLAAAVLAVCLIATIWDPHRPLPPPRISRYAQITHDGRRKWLAGVDASRIYANEFTLSSIEQVPISGGELDTDPGSGARRAGRRCWTYRPMAHILLPVPWKKGSRSVQFGMFAYRMAPIGVWLMRGMRPIHLTGFRWPTLLTKETSGSFRPTGLEPTSWARWAPKPNRPLGRRTAESFGFF